MEKLSIKEPSSERQLQSKFSLEFQNPQHEKGYRSLILSELSSALGIDHTEKIKTYLLSFYMTSILYSTSYISSYLEGYLSVKTLIIQLTLLLGAMTLASALYYYFFAKTNPSKHKSSSLVLTYLIYCEIIVFNLSFIKARLNEDTLTYGFTSILGLLPLIYASKFTIFNSFLIHTSVNLLICFTYLTLNLLSQPNYQLCSIEFLFLLLTQLIESRSFYHQESLLREKFISISAAIVPESHKHENSSPKTDIEEISHAVKQSIQMIPLINKTEAKRVFYLQRIFENLTRVINLLGSRASVYSVDIDGLDKNINNEDKIYLEETCIQPRRSQIMITSKCTIRKTIEVLKNYELQELKGILKRIGKEWNFDVFFLRDCTLEKSLKTTGCFCVQKYHLDLNFKLHSFVYQNFFERLEALYKPNPYHNSAHAADVLCSFLFIINQSFVKDLLQDYEILAIIIAILGHDVGHPGLTNRYLINSQDSLAITCKFYIDNDSSVLEMMHCASTFQIMQVEDHNILGTLSRELTIIVRSIIIDLILATDMAKHFDLLGRFKAKMINSTILSFNDLDQRTELLKIITKASDIGHAAKNLELHQKWTNLICEEFFAQGELEKQHGLPVSMYCDKSKTDIGKSQVGFIKNIVLPIFDCLNQCLNSHKIHEHCILQLEDNVRMWENSSSLKKFMTSNLESEENRTLKNRNETTIAGKTGRSSWSTTLFNNF